MVLVEEGEVLAYDGGEHLKIQPSSIWPAQSSITSRHPPTTQILSQQWLESSSPRFPSISTLLRTTLSPRRSSLKPMVQLPCPDAQQAVMILSQQLYLASSSFEQNSANGSTGATEGGKCYVAIKVSHCTTTSQDATHRATHLIQGSTTDRLSPQGKVYDVTGNKAYLPGASYNGKYILSLPRWHA